MSSATNSQPGGFVLRQLGGELLGHLDHPRHVVEASRTSTSSSASRPVALRVSALKEIRNRPPIAAIKLRY
jgi:hypothetical protein